MPNLRIVPINAADVSTLSASPALVTTLPQGNVQLIARDRVARSTSLATQVITGHWNGSIKACSAWSALRSNLVGARLQLQLYSDVPLTVQIYDSTALDVYTGGPTWGNFNWGEVPWFTAANDPLAGEAPFIKFIPATYYAAGFKLTITNPGGMSAAFFELGRFWLGEYLSAPINPEYGLQLGWASATERGRTRGGSARPRRGERWREMKFRLPIGADADRATWLDLAARLDMSQPMLVSGFPTIGGRVERDYAMEGLFSALEPSVIESWNQWSQPISIEET